MDAAHHHHHHRGRGKTARVCLWALLALAVLAWRYHVIPVHRAETALETVQVLPDRKDLIVNAMFRPGNIVAQTKARRPSTAPSGRTIRAVDSFQLIQDDLQQHQLSGRISKAGGISLACSMDPQSPTRRGEIGLDTPTALSPAQKSCQGFFFEARVNDVPFHLVVGPSSGSSSSSSASRPPRQLSAKAIIAGGLKNFLNSAVTDEKLRQTVRQQGDSMHTLAVETLSELMSPVVAKAKASKALPTTVKPGGLPRKGCPSSVVPSLPSLASSTSFNVTIGVLITSTVAVADLVQFTGLPSFRRVLKSTGVTYVVLGDKSRESNAADYRFLNDLPSFLAEEKKRCEMHVLEQHDSEFSSDHGATVMRFTCGGVQESDLGVLTTCDELFFGVDISARNDPATHATPVQCTDLGGQPSITGVVKLGTKTAIYRGEWNNEPVIWKNFDVLQYASFEGFRELLRDSSRLEPLINYPVASCIDDSSRATVWQAQRFVRNDGNLKKFMKSRGKVGTPTALSWKVRLQIAMQIACIFQHLHSHPLGQFAFDDNHPEQYLIRSTTSDDSAAVQVVLVDIDTLQLGVPTVSQGTRYTSGDSTSAGGGVDPSAVGKNITFATKCRCFYCKGRSNCEFINTMQALKGCGQLEATTKAPHVVLQRECDTSSDGFFVAQLLLYLVNGTGPWPGLSHSGVVKRLQQGVFPSAGSGNPRYDSIVQDLFSGSLPVDGVALLNRLAVVCAEQQGSCGFDRCPSPRRNAATPYRDVL